MLQTPEIQEISSYLTIIEYNTKIKKKTHTSFPAIPNDNSSTFFNKVNIVVFTFGRCSIHSFVAGLIYLTHDSRMSIVHCLPGSFISCSRYMSFFNNASSFHLSQSSFPSCNNISCSLLFFRAIARSHHSRFFCGTITSTAVRDVFSISVVSPPCQVVTSTHSPITNIVH